MSDPERLGFPEGPPMSRTAWCGGALLRVDREQYRAMERDGIRWATRSDVFRAAIDPNTGMAHARVACGDMARPGEALCASCAGLEYNARLAAREAQRTAAPRREP